MFPGFPVNGQLWLPFEFSLTRSDDQNFSTARDEGHDGIRLQYQGLASRQVSGRNIDRLVRNSHGENMVMRTPELPSQVHFFTRRGLYGKRHSYFRTR